MRSWRRLERLIGLRNAGALAIVGVGLIAGCSARPRVEAPMAQQLSAQVRSILGANRPSADYHQERTRLREMGPDLDVILIGLIGDTRARAEARADALILLADRGSPLALPTLASALQSSDERLRSAAVLGLNRLAGTDPVAVELIRGATRDRSRTVRLNALQSLDIREVSTIREVLEHETDREVRLVGTQLIALAEARGAPLSPDVRGNLRTVGGEDEPQIVFRAFEADSVAGVAQGDLRIELPAQRDIPLASSATVVGGVVPAFFSPNRGHVVFESEGRIGVVDIETRSIRWVASGIAPRPVPFTNRFVFLEERVEAPTFDPEPRVLVYEVYLAAFDSPMLERIGELTARSTATVHGSESPVRWMVVDEVGDGLMLRGENLDTFMLPAAVWAPTPFPTSDPR